MVMEEMNRESAMSSELRPGRGAYAVTGGNDVYASLTGRRSILPPPPDSPDQRPIVEVTGHKAHGIVPEPGSTDIARVKKVMAKMASADIMCVGENSVREKFAGIIRAYYLSTEKNELGVVSAESAAGATMIPISWTEMQCPSSGQVEQRKVAKV
ncbi:Exosome complex component CSL4-like protein [Drosera capensis]